ncbi:uncharacterized protein I303_106117 [Kwoniella dejecticola CBS 10117]|uniref:Uncharacterized protein n=1 Tax=Kwoniella dejecticola CBS 10117 TaxID=1296121 RepID=A0A1A6A1B2_9TREE|nr:uncharacterized protein I303_06136 [Kwoniella dejecticola CBS 10117]OBR83853.1 hypothetical protein I303_06136 [Kwoniella dejecticola CBS 10117]
MSVSTSTTRPAYSTHPTSTIIVSSTSFNSDFRSNATTLTAVTEPVLGSPGQEKQHKLEPTLDIVEETTETETAMEMDDSYADERPRRIGMDLSKRPSVRDRASQFEQQQASTNYSSSSNVPRGRPLPQPFDMGRTRSTSPLRINRKVSSDISTPPQKRRVPVPATAPSGKLSTQRRTYEFENESVPSSSSDRLPPVKLDRGSGSAKRMIQQWESLPNTPVQHRVPTSAPMGMGARVMSKEYLDQKPLPIPRANPIPSSSNSYHYHSNDSGPSHLPSSSKSAYAPSPLQNQHLRTPTQPNRKRAATLSPSASSYSLSPSPSGEKRKRNGGRSPLKDMLNKFGGGIQAIGRKAKGKNKEKTFGRSESFGWEDNGFTTEERLGTNGLPGGIVFSDRMGAEEMGISTKTSSDPNVVRTSAAMYLIPTPCSSVSAWGSWLSSWATLTPTTMYITYCPIFPGPSSGHSTPRRVLSGTNPSQSAPAVPFSQIPQPDSGVSPDVEMAMKDCVEVRSLRRDEVKGRGIPPVPEGVGTEVLEMVWSDGSKRYIGVEGVAGRLGWVSAIWDVLLACKSTLPAALPPPSPSIPSTTLSGRPNGSLPPLPGSSQNPPSPFSSLNGRGGQTDFHARLRALETRSSGSGSGSSAPPVQKVGDTWVAGSALGMPSSDIELPNPIRVTPQDQSQAGPLPEKKADANTAGLRDSVQRMFDLGPDPDLTLERPRTMLFPPNQGQGQAQVQVQPRSPSRQSTEMSERIRAWSNHGHSQSNQSQPSFSRTSSNKSTGTSTEDTFKSIHLAYTRPDPDPETDMTWTGYRKPSETVLSFDPNDLNPSRSASQVRRPASTVVMSDDKLSKRYGMMIDQPILEESSTTTSNSRPAGQEQDEDENATAIFLAKPALTHISHVTFPKPAVGGVTMLAERSAGLATIKSGASTTSSTGTRPSTEMLTPETRPASSMTHVTTLTSLLDPSVISRLDSHSNEHVDLSKQVTGVEYGLKEIITSLNGLVRHSKQLEDKEVILPRRLDDKLDSLGLDIKNIENTLQLSNLANKGLPDVEGDIRMNEVNDKLDKIASLCEQVLSQRPSTGSRGIVAGAPFSAEIGEIVGDLPGKVTSATASVTRDTLVASPSEEEKSAGQEVAQIMADLTGGSSKNSPRLVGLQVLHNISAPSSPKVETGSSLTPPNDIRSPSVLSLSKKDDRDNADAPVQKVGGGDSGNLPEAITDQVGQVLSLVTELKEARTLQTQQTTDIARYLNELNGWLEKFVVNSSGELSTLSKRLNILVGSSADGNSSSNGDHTSQAGGGGGGQPGLPDLVADLHSMMSEQKRRNDSEGAVGQRLDALLGMMGEERERASGQQNTVEQVVSILDRQRHDNEMLLRAVATDLTAEIRGERMRFIEAMQQATSVNVSMHVEEFKKLLSTEVNRSMAELGQMREEKKVLEQQISDLFALMAKHGGKGKKNAPSLAAPPSPGGIQQMLGSPMYAQMQVPGQGRGLPLPPH